MAVTPRKHVIILTLRENSKMINRKITEIVGVSIATINLVVTTKRETGSVIQTAKINLIKR